MKLLVTRKNYDFFDFCWTFCVSFLERSASSCSNTCWSLAVLFRDASAFARSLLIEIDENNQTLAEKKIKEMCEKLLVNMIIEDYKIIKIKETSIGIAGTHGKTTTS